MTPKLPASLALLAVLAGVGCTRTGTTAPPATDASVAAASSGIDARFAALATADLPKQADRAPVPGFDGATAWINVDHALSVDELRGKVVVVDFWTSCCINCIQTLPTLAALEEQFAGAPVAVVGIHSPKFDAESERERLNAAVRQYSIAHPVAVDGSMKVWNAWGVHSWPTIVVLDAHGRVVWTGSGEPNKDELTRVVATAVVEAQKEGAANAAPIAGIHPTKEDAAPLAFPGKVAALADGGLAIADTGHHRVVLVDAAGKTTAVVGSGLAGKTDGSFGEASFKKPQGLAELDGVVYVADTENHELRAIDRGARTVTTVAGTGALGKAFLDDEATPARSVALRSPWDLAAVGKTLYVALAGSHQIGAFDPKSGTIRRFAGDGRERRRDGAGPAASFAQPSGLASDGKSTLFVADAETSSVRAIDLATANVRTVVGKDLFVFGDVDGDADSVRLKHPIGIAFAGGALYVADTYNSKIKKIDPATGRTSTWATGLFEPAGLTARGGEIVVADTDRNRLVVEPAGTALVPAGLEAPARGVSVAKSVERAKAKPEERVALAATAARGGKLHVAWQIPAGTGVNPDAPYRVKWDGGQLHGKGAEIANGFDVPVAGESLVLDVDLVICDIATHAVCVPVRRELDVTVRLDAAAASPAAVTAPLPAARP